MNKKDLVTLAEVAQLEIHPHSSYLWVRRYTSNGEDYNLEIWQPHLDIKQAMECLEAIRNKFDCDLEIRYYGFTPTIVRVRIWKHWNRKSLDADVKSDELKEAICKAVLKAVEEAV